MAEARKGSKSGPEGGQRGAGVREDMQAGTAPMAPTRKKVANIRKQPGEEGRRRRRFAGS
jgi:hypothetical protein